MGIFNKAMLSIGGGAMLALSVAPAMAAVHRGDGKAALEQSSDYRGKRYRNRDRVDGGDVLLGIGLLAGLAILADASKDANKDRRTDDYPIDYDEPSSNYDNDYDRPRGNDVGDAVEACSAAAEAQVGNGVRVDQVNAVDRDGDGWRVEGEMSSGERFSCSANNGVADSVDIDGGY